MERGDVWWSELPRPWGSRPAVLVARSEAYSELTWVVVAPLTRRIRNIPTVVVLDPDMDGVREHSAITLDHMQAIRVEQLTERITRLRPEKMREIDRAIHFALGLRNCRQP